MLICSDGLLASTVSLKSSNVGVAAFDHFEITELGRQTSFFVKRQWVSTFVHELILSPTAINWNERAIEVAEGRIISVLRIEHERDVARREIAEFDASPPHEVILSVIFRGAIRQQSR